MADTTSPEPPEEDPHPLHAHIQETLNALARMYPAAPGSRKAGAGWVALSAIHDRGKENLHFQELSASSFKVGDDGAPLSALASMEKQHNVLLQIVDVLSIQREEAQDGARSAARFAAWSLAVAVLALLPPVVELALKLFGFDL